MMRAPSFRVLPPTETVIRPNDISVWTNRDYDIVQTLAIRVRVLALRQAARIWWPSQTMDARVRRPLDLLVDGGLLERYIINAHPLLEPMQPLIAWEPSRPRPDSRSVSDQARIRWSQPAIATEVFVASKKTANLFGGETHGLPPLEHRDHDLLLSDVYVHYRLKRSEQATHWIGEDFLPKAGFQTKDPDAFLVDDDGHPIRVVESSGRYSRKQVESFHDHCVSLDIPYEIW